MKAAAAAELCSRMGWLGWRRGTGIEDLDPSVELKWTQTKRAGDSGVLLRKRTQDLFELIPQTQTHIYRHSGGCLQASLHQMSFAFQQNNKMAVPSQRTKRHPKKNPKSIRHRNRWGEELRGLPKRIRSGGRNGNGGYRHGRDGDERGEVGAPNAKAKGLSWNGSGNGNGELDGWGKPSFPSKGEPAHWRKQ